MLLATACFSPNLGRHLAFFKQVYSNIPALHDVNFTSTHKLWSSFWHTSDFLLAGA